MKKYLVIRNATFHKAIVFLFFVTASLSVGCAEDSKTPGLPKLPQRSEKLEDFVPDFWNIEFIRQDDLNKDGQLDTIMLEKIGMIKTSFGLRIVTIAAGLIPIQEY